MNVLSKNSSTNDSGSIIVFVRIIRQKNLTILVNSKKNSGQINSANKSYS